ncbi:MAG: hypothetical protein ABF703_07365 [Oenococcus sp.]|uniref:hypothetical protein n=1 Tax=Oenococcus TaxID=46254 RepID=UPI0021E8EC8A|nr:hypothetical protein [Oenococcus kitaharae]MCV3296781.1 hypothetical protein [Oenococcus kitaharae]
MTIAFVSSLRAAYANLPFVKKMTARKLLLCCLFAYTVSVVGLFFSAWASLRLFPSLLRWIVQQYPLLKSVLTEPMIAVFFVMLVNFVVFVPDIRSVAAATKKQPLLAMLARDSFYRWRVAAGFFAQTFFKIIRIPIVTTSLVLFLTSGFMIRLTAIAMSIITVTAALSIFLQRIESKRRPLLWLNPLSFATAFLIAIPIKDFIQEALSELLIKKSIGTIHFHLDAFALDWHSGLLLGSSCLVLFLPACLLKPVHHFSYMKDFKSSIAKKSLSDAFIVATPIFYLLSGFGLSILGQMTEVKVALGIAFMLLVYPAVFLMPSILQRFPEFFEIKCHLDFFIWRKNYALLIRNMLVAISLYLVLRLAPLYLLALCLAAWNGWVSITIPLILLTSSLLLLLTMALQLAGLTWPLCGHPQRF